MQPVQTDGQRDLIREIPAGTESCNSPCSSQALQVNQVTLLFFTLIAPESFKVLAQPESHTTTHIRVWNHSRVLLYQNYNQLGVYRLKTVFQDSFTWKKIFLQWGLRSCVQDAKLSQVEKKLQTLQSFFFKNIHLSWTNSMKCAYCINQTSKNTQAHCSSHFPSQGEGENKNT